MSKDNDHFLFPAAFLVSLHLIGLPSRCSVLKQSIIVKLLTIFSIGQYNEEYEIYYMNFIHKTP